MVALVPDRCNSKLQRIATKSSAASSYPNAICSKSPCLNRPAAVEQCGNAAHRYVPSHRALSALARSDPSQSQTESQNTCNKLTKNSSNKNMTQSVSRDGIKLISIWNQLHMISSNFQPKQAKRKNITSGCIWVPSKKICIKAFHLKPQHQIPKW